MCQDPDLGLDKVMKLNSNLERGWFKNEDLFENMEEKVLRSSICLSCMCIAP